MPHSFDPFPTPYRLFFTVVEPAVTLGGVVYAVFSPLEYHQNLIPPTTAPIPLDVHPASIMAVRQLGSCPFAVPLSSNRALTITRRLLPLRAPRHLPSPSDRLLPTSSSSPPRENYQILPRLPRHRRLHPHRASLLLRLTAANPPGRASLSTTSASQARSTIRTGTRSSWESASSLSVGGEELADERSQLRDYGWAVPRSLALVRWDRA